MLKYGKEKILINKDFKQSFTSARLKFITFAI